MRTGPFMPDFLFLNDGFVAGGSDEVRRQIRSVATRYSHHNGDRKPKARAGQGQDERRNRRKRKPKTTVKTEPAEDDGTERLLVPLRMPSRATSTESVMTIKTEEDDDDDDSMAKTMYVRTPSPRKTAMVPEADDPFETYPVPAQPWFSKLLFHFNHFTHRAWANHPISHEQRHQGILFVQRKIREDASYFYMNLLSIAGELDNKGQISTHLLPWLTAKVVASVNEAIDDPKRSLSPATIMTVARIMLHESILGDSEVGQNVHRRAFARMVVLAGGVDALNLPEVLRCSWSWTESLLARKTGVAIGEMEPALVNERTFRRERDFGEDMKVLAGYHERREWREEHLCGTGKED